jgi:tRNA-splicing ligase RtcB
MKVITTEKKPIKLWLDDIEDGALAQAKNLANLPFIHKHVAIMPDAHQGYGMPIGGVMATEGVIVPNAVGVDIGCGMIAVKTSIADIDQDQVKQAMGKIREVVPVGFSHQKEDQEWEDFGYQHHILVIQREQQSAKKQLGTLGGGNHFIEIQKGNDGFVWLMVHSGSRNFGYKIAKEYHEKAKAMCQRWHSDIPDPELSFLPLDTDDGVDYFEAMNFALRFAYANRKLIMDRAFNCLCEVQNCDPIQEVNIHHNYAAWENHFDKNVIVHRKGATLAREGTMGIIPGSQGTKSYIVKGRGNKDSFNSCSHGAGRKMGRKQATRELDLDNEIKRLDDQGIVHSIRGVHDLDEAAGAYKDINVVMGNQIDLVDIVVELTPLGVIKG